MAARPHPPGEPTTETLEFTKKILLVGDGAVGKTSLVRRYVHDIFADRYIATIGTKTTRKELKLEYEEEGVTLNLELAIWDILGQKGVERSHQLYFKGAEGLIAVCDATRPDTLASVPDWTARVRELCGEIPGVVAANKIDLVEERETSDAEVGQVAAGLGMKWLRTSARTGENVDMLFFELGSKLGETIVTRHIVQRDAAARAGASKKSAIGRRRPKE